MQDKNAGLVTLITRRRATSAGVCVQCGDTAKGYLGINGWPQSSCFSDECEDKASPASANNRGKFIQDGDYSYLAAFKNTGKLKPSTQPKKRGQRNG